MLIILFSIYLHDEYLFSLMELFQFQQKHLMRRAGSSLMATVLAMLRALGTDQCLSQFSRDGKRNKLSLAAVPGDLLQILKGTFLYMLQFTCSSKIFYNLVDF